MLVVSLAFIIALRSHSADAAPTPPPATAAYYMTSVNTSSAFSLGYAIGQTDASLPGTQDRVAILDFGQAWTETFGGIASYGTNIFGANTFVGVADIEAAAEQFGYGYWAGTGTDTTSTIRVLVSTNNYGVGAGGNRMTYGHGQVWEVTSNDVDAWLTGHGYGGQVRADSGADLELDWNSSTVSRAWVDGFASNSGATGRITYDFGDAAGCSSVCNNSWTKDDVWYISWGASPAYAIPEIYVAGMPAEWHTLSAYAASAHGNRMNIQGALSEYSSCTPCSEYTAAQSWSQLYDALDADSVTRQTTLRWSADIRYQ